MAEDSENHHRKEGFKSSCCPPNIAQLIKDSPDTRTPQKLPKAALRKSHDIKRRRGLRVRQLVKRRPVVCNEKSGMPGGSALHKIRVYVDTSVFGGTQDEEFAEATKAFFEGVEQGKFVLLIS